MVYGLVTRRTVFHLLTSLWVSACAPTTRPTVLADGSQQVCAELLGICFDLPNDWHAVADSGALLFVGPEGGDAAFATVSLQATLSDNLPIDAAYDSIAAPALSKRHTQRLRETLVSVQGTPALLELVEQDQEDHRLRRLSLYVNTNGFTIVMSYLALARLFDAHLWVFDRALESLMVATPAP